uniref:Uncharacterized protein n=1 Tax=Strigamia maritima TaxID=126957 RepID=T1IPL4_STRMM
MALHSFGEKTMILLLTVYWTCILASHEESVETLLNVDNMLSERQQKPPLVSNFLKLLAKITNADNVPYYPLYPHLKKKVPDTFLDLNYLPKRNNNPSSGNNGSYDVPFQTL